MADDFWGYFSMDARGKRLADRFMLWIDAVGGYWVCLRDELTLGQPTTGGAVDIPIFADLSSRHARIRREGEGYVIEAWHEVRIDDRPVRDVGWLRDGCRIQLGQSVRMVFRRPHPLSGTARLDFLSRHRTQPLADAVLLMADTCVLGPKRNSHVVCRDWTQEAVLYRSSGHPGTLRGSQAGRLSLLHSAPPPASDSPCGCRIQGPFSVDGATCRNSAVLKTHSRVQGEGFSFNLDTLEA